MEWSRDQRHHLPELVMSIKDRTLYGHLQCLQSEKEKLDKKGQNEQDLASPVIVAPRRGITGLCVGQVQVVSESSPNPPALLEKHCV